MKKNFTLRKIDVCLEDIEIDEVKRFEYDLYYTMSSFEKNKDYINCFPITDIKNIDNLISLKNNEIRDIIDMFSFEVDKNKDLLQADENNRAFCVIYHFKNAVDLYEKAVDYLEDKLKGLKETKNLKNIIGSTFDYDYDYAIKEYPYEMYLAGVDDNSYTLVTDNLEDLENLAYIIKTNKDIDTFTFLKMFKFRYTN